MEARVNLGNRGFTLLEVLIALTILAIILLGNMAALSISYRKNVENILRDEAVRVAQEYADRYRDTKSEASCDVTVQRQVRNFTVSYVVDCTPTLYSIGGLANVITELSVQVTWNDPQGNSHNVTMVSYVQ